MYLRRLNTRSELVLIDGYTDSYGGGNDNLKIQNRRAKTIREHFVKNGIDPNRIETKDYAENAIQPQKTTFFTAAKTDVLLFEWNSRKKFTAKFYFYTEFN